MLRRFGWFPALLLLFLPTASPAVQLHWISGETNLNFTAATRCTLVVRADSAATLPREWRLLWVADSVQLQIVALDSLEVCAGDSASVYEVDGPSTPEDSTAHRVTAHFCSSEGGTASEAAWVIDLPDSAHGKLKVVYLDPEDSTRVFESNEARFNGGVSDSFPPAILLATRSHPSTVLRVHATGCGLAQAPIVEIAAPDGSWRLPMTVVEGTDNSLTAVANVAADLPTCLLRVGAASGLSSASLLDADTASTPPPRPPCVNYAKETNFISQERIQPKDFAIVASRDSFHVFYIRHDQNLSTAETEKVIGHLRSRDLYHWFPTENTMTAIQVRPHQWDNFHVWAPTIVRRPDDITYYMLYTGVQDTVINNADLQIQRIGVATSIDLNIWTQESTWVYEPKNTSWAEPDSTTYSGQQCRDPFVMEDPDSAGQYLMFFVAGSQARKPRMVVGVARTRGPVADFHNWYDVGALWNTDSSLAHASIVESPHALKDPGGRWWLYFTSQNPVDWQAIGRGDSTTFGRDSAFVCFETNYANVSSPIDPDTTHWSASDTLYRFFDGDQALRFWHGSEYLSWAPGHYEYLGAYDDNQQAVDISQLTWHGEHTFALNDSCSVLAPLAVEPKGGPSDYALSLMGASPSGAPVRLALRMPTRCYARLAMYDVLGRRLRTLLSGEVEPGRRELSWDGSGANGNAVGSGVYFARLTSPGGQRVVRIVFLR